MYILPATVEIKIKNRKLESAEYFVNIQEGSFSVNDSVSMSIFDTITAIYRYIPLSIKKVSANREFIQKTEFPFGDTTRQFIISKPITSENIFGSGIEKSGSIIRGFTVGTNKDFSLQSGLRLQLSGKLSEDIDIVASLTDENSPIQPEGNTESLEEIDKVFIQVTHKNARGVFGDYDLNKSSGEFGRVNRKLQGLLLEGNYQGNEAGIALASSKGKFNSVSLTGIDGVQGPYALSGANGERDVIVIAGSEKVFIDGEQLTRGENNDYTIDYSLAQITFTPKRLITNQSRIYADYEYTDRKFTRNLFSGSASAAIIENRLKLSFLYLRESDDQDAPIDLILSENDKLILKNAGDNFLSASRSGISLATIDSTGKIRGLYEKIDTILNTAPFQYYKYNPGSDSALYTITFSFVGYGNGDYSKQSVGVFRYVGAKKGDYLPIVFLPLPELKQFSNLVLNYDYPGLFSISAELAVSSYDKNRFSGLDDSDNNGMARNIVAKTAKYSFSLLGQNDLSASLSYRNRFVDSRFVSPERFSSVEFNRDYNSVNSPAGQPELLNELSAEFKLSKFGGLNAVYGKLSKGDNFISDRFRADLISDEIEKIKFDNTFDYVSTRNYGQSSKWIKNYFNLSTGFALIAPSVKIKYEDKKESIGGNDSLLSNSLNYYEVVPGLDLFNDYPVGLFTGVVFREDKLPLNGVLEPESFSQGFDIKLTTRNIRAISADFNITRRKKQYRDKFRNLGALDNENILIRNYLRYNLLNRGLTGDIFYEVSTQKTARLERVFVEVSRGNGNYRYIGDLNSDGIRNENEFEPTNYDGNYILLTIPGDELIPNVDLKTGIRTKYYLKDIVNTDLPVKTLVKPISGEFTLRIEENSSDRNSNNIYLLKSKSLLNDSTTIRGSQFLQKDMFIFEDDPELSFRLRFNQRKSLSQFNSGPERGYQRERSLRIRFKLVEEIAMQVDLINSTDNLRAIKNKIRNRAIQGNNIFLDFSYRPVRNVEVGMLLKTGRSEDFFPDEPTVMDNNSQILRMNISMGGIGRIRTEIERNEILINKSDESLPFELTGGNAVGKNYFARFNLDYRIALNLQSTVAYDARKLGGSRIIHNFRGEVRAFF